VARADDYDIVHNDPFSVRIAARWAIRTDYKRMDAKKQIKSMLPQGNPGPSPLTPSPGGGMMKIKKDSVQKSGMIPLRSFRRPAFSGKVGEPMKNALRAPASDMRRPVLPIFRADTNIKAVRMIVIDKALQRG